MSLDRYKNIIRLPKDFKFLKKRPYIPELTDIDYKRGYVERYFIQKSNDKTSPIYEVNSNGFSKFSKNPFWVTVALDWRLVGTIDEIKNSNSTSIRIASQTIPRIQLYLPNLLQFHKK